MNIISRFGITLFAMGVWIMSSHANEIPSIEDYALAADRSKVLSELIPGTEEAYYLNALNFQNQGELARVEALLDPWIKRYGNTEQVKEIKTRQMLLQYDHDPKGALRAISKRIGLHFDHQQQSANQESKIANQLNPELIARETLFAQAVRATHDLSGFEDRALTWLTERDLSGEQRRDLLSRLQYPDYSGLAEMIVADLNDEQSNGFGSLLIHRQLTLEQLQRCLELDGQLLNNAEFVKVYLTKLQPGVNIDLRSNTTERLAYLERLWEFAKQLKSHHNSLKAHILYHILDYDLNHDRIDSKRFLLYLQLPRQVAYINREFVQHQKQLDKADINASFDTGFATIRDDTALVDAYLLHFFTTDRDMVPFAPFIDDGYLKTRFAEAMIVHGIGDMEQWYSWLQPDAYQTLKERVDIDFAPANKQAFSRDEAVAFDLYLKNVKQLIIKVYKINAFNFYQQEGRDVDTSINLDGLIANHELITTYDAPPLHRVKHHFEFPMLLSPGVYVVDFIGNGKASRVIVRKGSLDYLLRTGAAGQVFTVIDEAKRICKEATIWVDGHEYVSTANGEITVPFTTEPKRQAIILRTADSTSLRHFQHQAEHYSLDVGFHVEREALIKHEEASVLVRPLLKLNGMPIALDVLETPRLLITSKDHGGIETNTESQLRIQEDQESVFTFRVPERLHELTFTLTGKVRSLSTQEVVELKGSKRFVLNEIDTTTSTEDLFLARSETGFVVALLGRTGEPKVNQPVIITLKHKDFREAQHMTLSTDRHGVINLGELPDIAWIAAKTTAGASTTWEIGENWYTPPKRLVVHSGETAYLAYMGNAKQAEREEFALFEVRGDNVVADCFSHLALEHGFLQIRNMPPGEYELILKAENHKVQVLVLQGPEEGGYLFGDAVGFAASASPLNIPDVTVQNDVLTLHIANATPTTRVHIGVTHYMPAFHMFANLVLPWPESNQATLSKTTNAYITGRDIGDEYRYILARKYSDKFLGNSLSRPGLLLNPWATRDTRTERQTAMAGDDYASAAYSPTAPRMPAPQGAVSHQIKAAGQRSNLDFLAEPGMLLTNLKPDEQGNIMIKRALLGSRQNVYILAVDEGQVVVRQVVLGPLNLRAKDLRLRHGLDPQEHFTEQKRIELVEPNDVFQVDDLSTVKFEVYDSISDVYALYTTLSQDPNLAEFRFIEAWSELDVAQKRAKYSKYACHELNFFLFHKDRVFFDQVVMPYIANKKDKTFMDHWLLQEDLSVYMEPWAFGRLNVVERILLGQRLPDHGAGIQRYIDDSFSLLPANIDRFNLLFDTALKRSSLEVGANPMQFAVASGEEDVEMLLAEDEGMSASMDDFDSLEEVAPPPSAMPAKSLRKTGKKRGGAGSFRRRDAAGRAAVRPFYRQLDTTKELVENNYYKIPIEQQVADLITVNAFWHDYSLYSGKEGFYSLNLADATHTFSEMMLAMAVLDLPFTPPDHKTEFKNVAMTMQAKSPLIIYHKSISKAAIASDHTPILVSQNFFRNDERYHYVNNEQIDKYVTDEFLTNTAYGGQIVLTNPTSARQKLSLLLQIPEGALPLLNSQMTSNLSVELAPYHTHTAQYFFYFPLPGDWAHYPVHVASNGQPLTSAVPFSFHVVNALGKLDTDSWAYVSQQGTDNEVLDFLRTHNILRLNLEIIAFRCRRVAFFDALIQLLNDRHVYNDTIWSYSIKHNRLPAMQQYLQHQEVLVANAGDYLQSTLVNINPVDRHTYQQMEYDPLVNARTHPLGNRKQILNDAFYAQYQRWLKLIAYRPALDNDAKLSAVYYLLLQGRIAEALQFFKQVDARQLTTTLQYDALAAYLAFFTGEIKHVANIVAKYADYPVDRWRKHFAEIGTQLAAIDGVPANVMDPKDREQQQAELAGSEPVFDFTVQGDRVTLNYHNMDSVVINYYLMDLELLFSRNPMVGQQAGGQFAYIRPNQSQNLVLSAADVSMTFALPHDLQGQNVMVEIAHGGLRKAQAYYANTLAVRLIQSYGQVEVATAGTHVPLGRVYIKAYAKMQDGEVRFYKDGYTDLRGYFDYASLSTDDLLRVERFFLLISSPTHGSIVREVSPPKR